MKKNKLLRLSDIKLSNKKRKEMNEILSSWVEYFKENANGKEGMVRKFDPREEGGVFYLTDCRDIIAKDPEFRKEETGRNVWGRKKGVFMQLFLKWMMGEEVAKPLVCGHCSSEKKVYHIKAGGYVYICDNCGTINMTTEKQYFYEFMEEMRERFIE